jgi:hypothetical protein
MDISAKVMVWFKSWTEFELENFNRICYILKNESKTGQVLNNRKGNRSS